MKQPYTRIKVPATERWSANNDESNKLPAKKIAVCVCNKPLTRLKSNLNKVLFIGICIVLIFGALSVMAAPTGATLKPTNQPKQKKAMPMPKKSSHPSDVEKKPAQTNKVTEAGVSDPKSETSSNSTPDDATQSKKVKRVASAIDNAAIIQEVPAPVENSQANSIQLPNWLNQNQHTAVALAVAMLLATAGGGFFAGARRKNKNNNKKSPPSGKPLPTNTEMPSTRVRTPSKKPVHVKLHGGASELAYIRQSDWADALSRKYGVNTQAGANHAVVSVSGARTQNEDFACMFELPHHQGDTWQCMLVADGCGGHAAGREASSLAIRVASEALIQCVDPSPDKRIQTAFDAASQALSDAGKHWDRNSLRTTLIIVVANASHYFCGWIGDGGIHLHRKNGEWELLMQPHQSQAQNLLTASLGPDLVGNPSFAQYARQAGDRLYLGSDGIFDVYDDGAAFWSWFEKQAHQRPPQECLSELLNTCAKDARFDDNMTVAYLHSPLRSSIASTTAHTAQATPNTLALQQV